MNIKQMAAACCMLGGALMAAAAPVNTVKVQDAAKPSRYNPMIFGSFLEHFDNQVYGGVYDPQSKFADEDGFRKDVLAVVNKSPDKATPVTIDFASLGKPAPATVKAKVLTGDSPDAFNTIENPDRVHIEAATLAVKDGTVEIPAHTVAILYVE